MSVEILQDLVKHVVGQPQGQPGGALRRVGGRLHDLNHWGGRESDKAGRAFLLESYMPLACPCSLAKKSCVLLYLQGL